MRKFLLKARIKWNEIVARVADRAQYRLVHARALNKANNLRLVLGIELARERIKQ